MKKLFLISLVFPAVAFAATPTNTTTIPNLTFASTPLAGTERVPVYQSGMKSATVAQITAAPTTAAAAAQAYAEAASNNLGTALGKISNSFTTVSNNFLVVSNNYRAFSNSVAATVSALGTLANSNGVTLAQVAGAGSIAGRGSNDFYLASNPSGFQNAGQVTTSINSSLAAAGIVTNAGIGSFSNIRTPTFNAGTNTTLSAGVDSTNLVIDLNAGSYQVLTVMPRSGGNSTFNFAYTNATDGQNVYVLVKPSVAIQYKYQFSGSVDSWASTAPPYTVSSTAAYALLNFQVVGGIVIATRGTHP